MQATINKPGTVPGTVREDSIATAIKLACDEASGSHRITSGINVLTGAYYPPIFDTRHSDRVFRRIMA